MSAIIKSGSTAGLAAVRSLSSVNALASRKVPSKEDEERERLLRRVSVLEGESVQRDAAIADLRAEIDAAFARGKAAGREDGLAEAERREAERLSLLEKAMGEAGRDLAGSLSSLERLAALLARDSLEVILGDPAYRQELLAALIAKQVAQVEKSALVEISVSVDDFPTRSSLSDIAGKAGLGARIFATSADIAPGGCTMRFRLGSQEIGIDQQWGAVRERLAELSLPVAPA
jgi:flagellar biosynthesis/type III secretory pathway protein FliH